MHEQSLMINRRGWAVIMAVMFSILLLTSAEAEETPEWLELTVTPAAEPRPALQYRFVHRRNERRHGNAVPMYARAMIHLGSTVDWEETGPRVRDWQNLPLEELPVDEVRKVLGHHQVFLDEASLYDHAEWETAAQEHGISALLPELGQMRNLARLVSLRTRIHILEGDYESAIRSLRTGFTMATHVAEEPIVINHLVGISITAMLTETAYELIASPNSPNLYWALAQVKAEHIDTRPAIEFESYLMYWSFPALRDLSTVPMSLEQADRLWEEIFTSPMAADFGGVMWEHPLPAMGIGITVYAEAKARLIELGHDVKAVETMSVKQTLLLHWLIEFEHWVDEMIKWHSLPYADAWEGQQRSQQAFERHQARMSAATNPFLMSLPHFDAARATEERSRRRLALLRCVEAIRMHAAANNGQLPESLDDITIVPAPADPSNNMPFRYELQPDGRTFTLQPAETDNRRMAVRFKEDRLRVTVEPQDQ
ncbi:hypothetical protein ACERK3_17160 [Phycisphaerales bacterium AB-hyl4]|uniref:Uncharacterized protein n=1 Tax=Natronomicrosphaera hydrolytica TaxID=3242702 RepID=A0ABV4UB21_9BACT